MKITQKQILIKDLVENYKDDGDGGVYNNLGRKPPTLVVGTNAYIIILRNIN